MPSDGSHCHCVVPNCSNRRNSCKFGLVAGENSVYELHRLCGATSKRVRCCENSEICQSVPFQRLPKDEDKRKKWLASNRELICLSLQTLVFAGRILLVESAAGSTTSQHCLLAEKPRSQDYQGSPRLLQLTWRRDRA